MRCGSCGQVWGRGPSRMRSRMMMKLSDNGEDVQEEDSSGSRLACLGFVVIHSRKKSR